MRVGEVNIGGKQRHPFLFTAISDENVFGHNQLAYSIFVQLNKNRGEFLGSPQALVHAFVQIIEGESSNPL